MTQTIPEATDHSLSPHILEQAAGWFVLLASGEAGEEDRLRWKVWLAAHPAHERAWQRAQATAERFAGIPRDQARASLHALTKASGLKSRGRRNALKSLAVLIAVGIVGWQSYQHSDWSADAMTAVGEQREMTLADGSQVLLDTDSAIDIEFSDTSRVIRLRRGQIMVETGRAPANHHRSFAVETDEGRVIALGTRFTVRQEAGNTRLTVLEDRVAIQVDHPSGEMPILGAGQSARFSDAGLIEQTDSRRAETAWIKRMLIANDMSLPDFLAELARYRTEPIVCDAAVRSLRISGSFPLYDTDRVLAALGETLPVRLVHVNHMTGKTSLVVRPK